MKFILALAALLSAIPVTRAAAQTSQLAFVTEFARELGVNERMRELGERDLADAGPEKWTAIIRSSTRITLELNSQISMLRGVALKPPFDKLPGSIIKFYEYKVGIHDQMVEMATAFASGPKAGVDYGAMLAEAPKLTAMLEHIDRSLLQATPMVFAMLIADAPDKQGHMSRLRITRAERDRLVRSLQISFGDKMERQDQNLTVSAATVLRDYLVKKGYKCADDPL